MKSQLLRFISITLALVFCFGFAACTEGGDDITTEDAVSDSPTDPTDNTVESPEATEEATTEEVTTAAPPADEPAEIAVKWNFGYVASSTHGSKPNQLVENGSMYSYSDVITVEKEGTTITFADDNTNSNGDTNYASAAAYVFSSWKRRAASS